MIQVRRAFQVISRNPAPLCAVLSQCGEGPAHTTHTMANAFELKSSELTPGQRVRVHLHITQTKRLGHPVWSVSGSDGKVICHTQQVSILCEGIKVQQGKRDKMLAGGKKAVCLWAVGVVTENPQNIQRGSLVRFDPRSQHPAQLQDGTPYSGGGTLHFTAAGLRPSLSL